MWRGSGANATEFATAEGIAHGVLQGERDVQLLQEGSEPGAFWEALGGKADYPDGAPPMEAPREPLLYQCSTHRSGTFSVDEPIYDFSQADLDDEDVFLLDCHSSIFIWVGRRASPEERDGGLALGTAYAHDRSLQLGEDFQKVTSIIVHSGAEPEIFTCHFLGWEPRGAEAFVDPYEVKLQALIATKESAAHAEAGAAAAPVTPVLTKSYTAPGELVLSYDALSKPSSELPRRVDPTRREQYLPDDEFERVLGSPRSVFNEMPAWKRTSIKRDKGLF